jgi:hypothetical protein
VQKVNENESLKRYRNGKVDVKTELLCLVRDKLEGNLIYCSNGIRYIGGTICIEAFTRNTGTCREDAKGEIQAENL